MTKMKKHTKEIFQFFWKHTMTQKWNMLIVVILIAINSISRTYKPILFKDFIDLVTSASRSRAAEDQLISILFLMLGIMFISWISKRMASFIADLADGRVVKSILQECFLYIQGHSIGYFNDTFVGSLIKKINRAPRVFETFLDKIVFTFWPMTIRIGMVLIVLTTINLWLGLLMVAWTFGFLGLNWFLSMYKLKYDFEKSQAETAISSVLADTLTNHSNIKLFSALDFEYKAYSEVLENSRIKSLKTWWIESGIDAIQGLLMIILEFTILYAAVRMWGNGTLTVGGIVLVQAYVLDIFYQLWSFGSHMRAMSEGLADAEEIIQVLLSKHDIVDAPEAQDLIVKQGKIEFKNVNFSYSEGSEIVFEDLSFKIKPGEKIALVGPSGGGKSTLTKLVSRLYDINSGEILIDNQNIAGVKLDSLRNHLALVPQDPILFHRSLAENIAYGHRGASKEEIIAASKLARCHDFVGKFNQGYDTLVGERGVKLSGGQRQRIAIARAILANAQVLILDEATSSLDSESEVLIQEALANLLKNKTTIIVAHRLSTIMKADRILVMEDGKITEDGSHAELLKKEGGLYKKLWTLQVEGYM